MKQKIKEVTEKLSNGIITEYEANTILFDLFNVNSQRELLINFNKKMAKLNSWYLPVNDDMIDKFIDS